MNPLTDQMKSYNPRKKISNTMPRTILNILLYIFLLAPFHITHVQMLSASTSPPDYGERVCLSLKVLAREVETAIAPGKPLRQDLQYLAGINWLEGYIVDPANNDIILIGQRRKNRPKLHFEDLLLNIINVWSGNVYPYCSLDPQPDDIIKINNLFAQISRVRNPDEMERLFSRLRDNCGSHKTVIGGLPRSSRHARVMLACDYHMKKVSQGLAELPDIPSCLDIKLQETKAAIQKGKSLPASEIAMSRFWFHYGKGQPTFNESERIVCLDRCSVVVLTERQRATADGTLFDSGEIDHQARTFAGNFSRHFKQVTRSVPQYADLENIYRLHAILRAMHFRHSIRQAGFNLNYFLRRIKYQEQSATPTAATMPGLVNYKRMEVSCKKGFRVNKYVLCPIVCGGVCMDTDIRNIQFSKDLSGHLDHLRVSVIKTRPHTNSLFWLI
jgi:hypothetical protein